MSNATAPTTRDVGRTIARLDNFGKRETRRQDQSVRVDGVDWTTREMIQTLADCLSSQMGHAVKLGKVTTRDVAIILAAHGVDSVTIDAFARRIAARVRAMSLQCGRMSATI